MPVGCVLTAQVVPLAWLSDWPGLPAPGIRLSRHWPVLAGSAFRRCSRLLAAVTWWQQRFQTPEATRGAVFWLLAIVIAAALCARWCVWRMPAPSVWTALPWLLYGLALAPRIWNGADLPYGIWFDEAQAGLEARRLLAEGRYTPITDTFGRDASLFYYLIAVAQQLIKDPVAAGRAVAALVGAANAPLLYLLGRELFGWRVGLAAGVLIATSRWHLDVSRLGWDPISLPVCVTLGFWLLARAIRRERWTDAVWAGMAFGLGLHGYIGFRAMPLVAIVLLMYAAWLRRWSVTASTARFAIFMGGLVLVALPVLVFAVQDPAGFNGRLAQTLIFSEPAPQAQQLDDAVEQRPEARAHVPRAWRREWPAQPAGRADARSAERRAGGHWAGLAGAALPGLARLAGLRLDRGRDERRHSDSAVRGAAGDAHAGHDAGPGVAVRDRAAARSLTDWRS